MSQFRPFRNKVIPLWTYAMVSEPLTDEQLARVAWEGGRAWSRPSPS
ncbi:hypothetical protein NKH77_53830 [Streptomyces sp. M19]